MRLSIKARSLLVSLMLFFTFIILGIGGYAFVINQNKRVLFIALIGVFFIHFLIFQFIRVYVFKPLHTIVKCLRNPNSDTLKALLQREKSEFYEIAELIVSYRDSSAKATREKNEARVANQAKSDFVARVSHELRTPLHGILAYTELVKENTNVADIHRYAKTIGNEAEILLALVNKLLDISKIESGKYEINPKPIDLMEVINNILDMMSVKARAKSIGIRCVFGEHIPQFLLADNIVLSEILLNLLNNAIKFTEEGTVTFSVTELSREGSTAKLAFKVIDTGIGIPEEKQHLLFKPFVQLTSDPAKDAEGSGLGLSIIRQLIELMHGSISCESKPNEGTAFTVELPLEICQESRPQGATSEIAVLRDIQSGASPISLLMAEDYVTNQEIIKAFLSGFSYDLTIVNNGKEALEALESKNFDLILLDINMPVMNGYETAKKIRTMGISVPIVAITADALVTTQRKCEEAGITDILTKPFARRQLLEKINTLVSQDFSSFFEEKSITFQEQKGDNGSGENPLPLNYSKVLKEFLNNKALTDATIEQFFNAISKQQKALYEFYENKEWLQLKDEMHKIKGGAGILCADEMRDIARKIEDLCRQAEVDIQQVGQLLKDFDTALSKLLKYWDTIKNNA